VWLGACAFVTVGDELSEGVHATAQAISALTRHAEHAAEVAGENLGRAA